MSRTEAKQYRLMAITDIKKGACIAPYWGKYVIGESAARRSRSDRVYQMMSVVTTGGENLYLKGNTACAATYVNDPIGQKDKEANVELRELGLTEGKDNSWHMAELRLCFYTCLFALKDITATPEEPVELLMSYGAGFWKPTRPKRKRPAKVLSFMLSLWVTL